MRFTEVSFTINGPPGLQTVPFPIEILINAPPSTRRTEPRPVVRHYVYQYERGPENGRIHIQGMMMFYYRVYRTTGVEVFVIPPVPLADGTFYQPHVHFNTVRSNYLIGVEYCTKAYDGGRWKPPGLPEGENGGGRIPGTRVYEYGVRPTEEDVVDAGDRTDLHDARDDMMNGMTIEEAVIKHSAVFAKAPHFLRACRGIYMKKPAQPHEVKVYVFLGAPGLGKSRRARWETWNRFGRPGVVWHRHWSEELYNVPKTKWMDGYDGQLHLLVDDIDYDGFKQWQMTETGFTNFLDPFQNMMEVKGGQTFMKHDLVIITSNQHPDFWFDYKNPDHRIAVLRRLNIIQFNGPFAPPNGEPWPEDMRYIDPSNRVERGCRVPPLLIL